MLNLRIKKMNLTVHKAAIINALIDIQFPNLLTQAVDPNEAVENASLRLATLEIKEECLKVLASAKEIPVIQDS